MKEIKSNNIKIPDEFGVFGFANELFGEHITPTLSTIDQQTVTMGTESFRLLLQMIENNTETIVEKKIVLNPDSCFQGIITKKKSLIFFS